MQCSRQCLQITDGSKMGVQCEDVLLPVAVVGFALCSFLILMESVPIVQLGTRNLPSWAVTGEIQIFETLDEAEPPEQRTTYRGESHVLYVIKSVDNSLPCPTAVLLFRNIARHSRVGGAKAICDDLVDRSTSPVIRFDIRSWQRCCGIEQLQRRDTRGCISLGGFAANRSECQYLSSYPDN